MHNNHEEPIMVKYKADQAQIRAKFLTLGFFNCTVSILLIQNTYFF